MPAEWEPHESTWLAWPHFRGDWPGKFDPIPWVYAEIIRSLTRHEVVDLIINDAEEERRAKKILDRAAALNENIRFHRWQSDRVWLRDSGCTFVVGHGSSLGKQVPPSLVSQKRVGVKWKFTAWAKYPNFKLDETLGTYSLKRRTFRIIIQPLVSLILGLRAGVRDAREHRPALRLVIVVRPCSSRRTVKTSMERHCKTVRFRGDH